MSAEKSQTPFLAQKGLSRSARVGCARQALTGSKTPIATLAHTPPSLREGMGVLEKPPCTLPQGGCPRDVCESVDRDVRESQTSEGASEVDRRQIEILRRDLDRLAKAVGIKLEGGGRVDATDAGRWAETDAQTKERIEVLRRLLVAACRLAGVEPACARSEGRGGPEVKARGLFAYAARRGLLGTYVEIAKVLGRESHATVHDGERRMQAIVDDPSHPMHEMVVGQLDTLNRWVVAHKPAWMAAE